MFRVNSPYITISMAGSFMRALLKLGAFSKIIQGRTNACAMIPVENIQG
jgi:hypothetical protein